MFSLGKGKENATPVCACSGAVPTYEAGDTGGVVRQLETVKVLGSGCRSCHTLWENTRAALKDMGLDLAVEYVTDMRIVADYGVMSTPALVVNEQVVSMGRVLSAAEAENLFRKLGY